jgi:alpha-tubulin suppressor-like RCC1 family protein
MGVTSAVQIGAGDQQTCARNRDGSLLCWGQDNEGQIGDGQHLLDEADVLLPTPVVNLTDAVELAVGSEHTCARTRDDAVWCWGADGFGQLGDGSTNDQSKPTPVMGL